MVTSRFRLKRNDDVDDDALKAVIIAINVNRRRQTMNAECDRRNSSVMSPFQLELL